jgi:hypothetical protein
MIMVGLDVWCFVFGDYIWGLIGDYYYVDWEIATASLVEDYEDSRCKIK